MSDTINAKCPWSGDAVSCNALTTYRDEIVGFCNEGCRDKFDVARAVFDQSINAAGPVPDVVAPTLKPYVKRAFGAREHWQVGDLRLKVYAMARDPAELASLPLAVMAAAESFALRVLPKIRAREGADHALGFATVHRGDIADWLLLRWWAHGDVCRATIASAKVGADRFTSLEGRHYDSCVWEQVVTQHERSAWISHMMSVAPDREAYMNDLLPDGLY